MVDEPDRPDLPDPETESSEQPEEERPTEEHEPTASDTQASELPTVEVLAQEVEELRTRAAERDDLLDKLQRTKADFINYQKRQERERGRWADEARRSFASRVLPVVDDLELALNAPRGSNADVQALLRGVEMVHAKLAAALREESIVPFESLGKPFDPAYHEGIARVERPDVAEHTIVEVLRKGYLIGDRVLRPARVAVARGGKAAAL